MKIVTQASSESGPSTAFGSAYLKQAVIEIAEEELGRRLKDFFHSFEKTLTDLPANCGPYNISQLTVSVQVTASGGIELVGKAEVGATGGLTFTLLRDMSNANRDGK